MPTDTLEHEQKLAEFEQRGGRSRRRPPRRRKHVGRNRVDVRRSLAHRPETNRREFPRILPRDFENLPVFVPPVVHAEQRRAVRPPPSSVVNVNRRCFVGGEIRSAEVDPAIAPVANGSAVLEHDFARRCRQPRSPAGFDREHEHLGQ